MTHPNARRKKHKVGSLFRLAVRLGRRFGWSCIPVDANKKALCRWTPYKRRRPTVDELRWLFRGAKRHSIAGLAVITGPASGGLCVRDFDRAEDYEAWAAAHPELAAALPTVRTARGFHVYLRCGHDPGRTANVAGVGEWKVRDVYVVLPPSWHGEAGIRYRWHRRPGKVIPEISDPQSTGLVLVRQKPERKGLPRPGEESQRGVGPPSPSHTDTPTPPHYDVVFTCPALPGSKELIERVEHAVLASLPTGPGQRNGKLFELASRLQGIGEFDGSERELAAVFDAWFKLALPTIRTKERAVSWDDFRRGWAAVRFPRTDEASLAAAIEEASKGPVPPCALRYRSLAVRRLVAVCAVLQRRAGSGTFFLDCRTAGRVLGTKHVAAWKWLKKLADDGVLERVERGRWHSQGRKGRASEYRYLGRPGENAA